MEIFRFDEEMGTPVSAFESRFRVARLVDSVAPIDLSFLHLPAGGAVGRHRAVGRQLLAVVSGSGWASGADGRRRALAVGRAALFEADELHEAGTEAGMVALCIQGGFRVQATAVTRDIVVEPYDPAWREWFDRLVAFVWPAVAPVALRIDHVGSTAVEGLAAKPIIDADVVVATDQDVAPALECLRAVGYFWRGELGVPGRQAFSPPPEVDLPAHHLYLVVENSKAHLDHRLLVEVLRSDPEARARYGELKRRNAELADRDIDRYVALKASFVAELLRAARGARGLPEASYWEPEDRDDA
jgi:GrpB-like predicted nucleotidyltransferase (UPF0157 family)